MTRLRGPGGCPWDREQTHATLRTYLIEETYEVLDALDKDDAKEMAEELGDLLLQVVFHAEMAREAGRFDIADIVSGIHDKLIRRHPHVFGDVQATTSTQVLKNWEQIKSNEKKAAVAITGATKLMPASILDGVSKTLPALHEAFQLTRRAAKIGFDWENVEGILEKLHEEISELQDALSENDRAHCEEEIGDLLFVAVNLARFLGFDPEVALRQSNRKFKSRFMDMEADAANSGKHLAQMSKEKLELLWEEAKARSRTTKSPGTES